MKPPVPARRDNGLVKLLASPLVTARPRARPRRRLPPAPTALLALGCLLAACDRPASVPDPSGTIDSSGSAAATTSTGANEPSSASRFEVSPGDPRDRLAPERVAVRNLLLITVDTLRADALGFAGETHASTPTLDQLAATGRVYDNAHAHNVVTLPSHANILTGRYPYQHGIRDNTGFVLDETIPTAATLLHAAGFATGAVVAAYPLDARFGLNRGFDHYDDQLPANQGAVRFASTERAGDQVIARGLDWWRQHAGERRFLWLHLFEPHAPYAPPEPYASQFADQPYLGEVAVTDAYLRPLLVPFLEGSESPTMIAFTSDHGEALGEHGERTHGLFAYEATLKVPLVLWAPGMTPGRSSAPARHIDLLPTLLEAVGVPVPDDLPGRSLLGPADDSATTYFEALTATLDRGWAPLRGIIDQGEKLVELPLIELYQLAEDPRELDNRADRQRRRVRALRDRLPAESEWPPPRAVATSSAERAALRSLGYIAGSAARKTTYTAEDDPKNLLSIDDAIHRFIDLFQLGRLSEATAVAHEVVRAQPTMSVAHEHLAQVLLEQGQVDRAIEAMERAVARDAASPSLIRQLSLSYIEDGRVDDAIQIIESRAESTDPEDLNTLGFVLAEGGRLDQAAAVLTRSISHDPTNPEAHQNLALVALYRQDWVEAESQASRALEQSPSMHHAWNYLGVANANLGRPRRALEAWERASALAPQDFDLLYNIAIVSLQTGDRSRAAGALRRFIDGAPPARYAPDIAKARGMLRQLEESP